MIEEYKKLLKEFVGFKSISTDPAYAQEIQSCADWLKKLLREKGFDVKVHEGYGNPVIVAEYNVEGAEETALIYGHYDVQPAEKKDDWKTDPFSLSESQGKLIARGVADNKGQILIHMVSIFDLIKKKKLKYNIKFLIEGNEETGSGYLEKFIKEKSQELKSDFVVVSDGVIVQDHPVLEAGFRGIINCALEIKVADTDLHSGGFGGFSPNAIYELSHLLSKIYNQNNQIDIEGFYDDVELIDPDEVKENLKLKYPLEKHTKNSGAKQMFSEEGLNFYTQTGLRPSIEITGVESGYTAEGYKNAIPAKAKAKINIRLVRDQNPLAIIKLFEEFIKKNLPDYVEYNLEVDNEMLPAIKLDVSGLYHKRAQKFLEKTYGEKVVKHYTGGTIPVVLSFEQVLKVPQLLIPFANEGCRMHGVDENFQIEKIEKGLKFCNAFFKR